MRIKRLHGNQDQYWDAAKSCAIVKSAIFKNPRLGTRLPARQGGQACESVVQTSYDIIKAHGGVIRVESPPYGQAGTEFIIQIPIKS